MLSYRWMALADTRMGKQEVLLWTLSSTLVLGIEARTFAHARRLNTFYSVFWDSVRDGSRHKLMPSESRKPQLRKCLSKIKLESSL